MGTRPDDHAREHGCSCQRRTATRRPRRRRDAPTALPVRGPGPESRRRHGPGGARLLPGDCGFHRLSADGPWLQGRRGDLLQPDLQPRPRRRYGVQTGGPRSGLGRILGAGGDLPQARQSAPRGAAQRLSLLRRRPDSRSRARPALFRQILHLSAVRRTICPGLRHQRLSRVSQPAARAVHRRRLRLSRRPRLAAHGSRGVRRRVHLRVDHAGLLFLADAGVLQPHAGVPGRVPLGLQARRTPGRSAVDVCSGS